MHHRLTSTEAARLGRQVDEYALFWLEDPAPAESQEAYRLMRHHTTAPLAVGEAFNSIWDCQQHITEQLIDYIRTTVMHGGGITHLRRILDLAGLYRVRSGSHRATDLAPVSTAAALDIAIPNFGIQEYMRHPELADEVFPHSHHFADGYLHPGDEAGLGIDIDETRRLLLLSAGDLPVNRLLDRTRHSW